MQVKPFQNLAECAQDVLSFDNSLVDLGFCQLSRFVQHWMGWSTFNILLIEAFFKFTGCHDP